MHRAIMLLGLGILGLALIVGTGATQDKKDKDKAKGMLPPGWKQLNLSKEQTQKIYEVQTEFRGKVKALEMQLQQLKVDERSQMVKVLTDEQKKLLQKLTIGNDTKPPEKR